MSPKMLFVILLVIGIILVVTGKRAEGGGGKVALMLCGILSCLFSVFGLVTAFL